MNSRLHSEYQREGDCGVFVLTGHRDFASSCDFWRAVIARVRTDGLHGVLIHDSAQDHLQMYEILAIEQLFHAEGLPRNLPVVLVDADAGYDSANVFGELVVQNRGWPLIRVFRAEAAARAWMAPVMAARAADLTPAAVLPPQGTPP